MSSSDRFPFNPAGGKKHIFFSAWKDIKTVAVYSSCIFLLNPWRGSCLGGMGTLLESYALFL